MRYKVLQKLTINVMIQTTCNRRGQFTLHVHFQYLEEYEFGRYPGSGRKSQAGGVGLPGQ